ncbi:hypothetical protein [Polaribacter sp. Asnod1-A03]|uniref:hypothetical protein n=1 Tax=Polaribacter sp. Asnod1-A03 TaxID=3160581 RepID=UPI003863966F
MRNLIILTLIISLFTSCFGDKKVTNVFEIGETSFINKNFKVNKINYTKGMSACNNITKEAIAKIYGVSASKVHVEDPTKSDRYKKDMAPACIFYVEEGDNDFMWLRGSIAVNREISKDEFMGDVAEAAGSGKNWEEAWSLKKSISKSAEWIPNLGKAALWNPKKGVLEIKFEGYTLVVNPLKNRLNKAETSKNRDYKKIAISMAKVGGYIN